MALSEIRVNTTKTRTGVGTITYTKTGPVITGIATADKFSGEFEGAATITSGNITATTGTFSGNVSVGGVLTYEDVTNVDSVGIITARGGIVAQDDVTFTTANSNNILFDKSDNLLRFGDNVLARFGNDNDLEMYHTGSTGYIKNTTGTLYIQDDSNIIIGSVTGSETGAKYIKDGAYELYHNNILKLATDLDGIRIGSGGGDNTIVDLHNASYDNGVIQYYNGSINLKTGSSNGDRQISLSTAGSERLLINSSGNIGIGEASPSYILDVKGDSGITQSPSSNSTAGQISIVGRNSGGSASAISRLKSYPDGSSNQSHFAIETRNSSAAMVERMRINSTGQIWIGSYAQYGPNAVNLAAKGVAITAAGENALKVLDSTSYAADVGGAILMGGNYRSSADTQPFVELKSFKENGTDTNYAYGFRIGTTPNGGSITERLRITSAGRLGLGIAAPTKLLDIAASTSSDGIRIKSTGNTYNELSFDANRTSANTHLGRIISSWNGTAVSYISFDAGSDTTNKDDGIMRFWTAADNNGCFERLRIDSSGNVIVGGTSVGANGSFGIQPSGHVRTVLTNGSGAGDTLFGAVGGVSNGFQINVDSSNNQNYYFHNGSSRTVSIRSTGKTEFGATGGNYGSNPQVVNIGSRAANIQGSLAIARGEALGGGTGPYMELVHGPDGGTQRVHSIYSFVGDLRVFADTNENLELRGTETIFKDNNNNIKLRVKNLDIETADNTGLAVYGGTGNHTSDSVIYSEKTNNNDWCYKATASGGSSTDYGMYIRCHPGGSYVYSAYDTSNNQWIFRVGGNGTIYAINTTVASISDRRLKENIVDANSQWDDIKALKFKNFTWKNSTDTTPKLGLISDEVEAVSPGLVEINAQSKEDIENNVPDPEYKNVKYSIVWMKAVKALQEAQARIETLEAKVAALEGS